MMSMDLQRDGRILMAWLIVTIGVLLQGGPVRGLSGGAPMPACIDMMPGHDDTPAQTTPPPYTVTVMPPVYIPGSQLTVTLGCAEGHTAGFRGYMLQVWDASNLTVGLFTGTDEEELNTVMCGLVEEEVVTHSDNAVKHRTQLTWRAPDTPRGTLTLWWTIVQNMDIFWVKHATTIPQADKSEL